jgi:RNA polymerase sigma factor (sigma-70 family)
VPTKRVTPAEQNSVRLYPNDVGRHDLLTKDDEVRLAQAVEAGRQAQAELDRHSGSVDPPRQRQLSRLVRHGDQATETFITANLRLVVSIARRYRAAELPLLDLIQEGNLGLIHAVEKYDWRRGFKFSTYATWWIRQAISRGIANTGRTVRLPVHAGDLRNQVIKASGHLEGQLGRRPTVAELAAEVRVDQPRVTEILLHVSEPMSLSEPLRTDSDAPLGDFVEDHHAISPFEAAAAVLLAEEVARMLLVLDEREQQLLRLRFGLDRGQPRTLDEVGAHFDLTRERIRQLEARAISKLRQPSLDGKADDLLTP